MHMWFVDVLSFHVRIHCETCQFLVMVCKETSHMLVAAACLSGKQARQAKNSCEGDSATVQAVVLWL